MFQDLDFAHAQKNSKRRRKQTAPTRYLKEANEEINSKGKDEPEVQKTCLQRQLMQKSPEHKKEEESLLHIPEFVPQSQPIHLLQDYRQLMDRLQRNQVFNEQLRIAELLYPTASNAFNSQFAYNSQKDSIFSPPWPSGGRKLPEGVELVTLICRNKQGKSVKLQVEMDVGTDPHSLSATDIAALRARGVYRGRPRLDQRVYHLDIILGTNDCKVPEYETITILCKDQRGGPMKLQLNVPTNINPETLTVEQITELRRNATAHGRPALSRKIVKLDVCLPRNIATKMVKSCPHCPYATSISDALERHIKTNHMDSAIVLESEGKSLPCRVGTKKGKKKTKKK